MKILRVRLRNLNSLRGDHELNFQAPPLSEAGLFAITGPTGAGKSTVLDAITLALYGRAARYGTTANPENMMSRHCDECSAEVEFQVPRGTFRAEWQLRRVRGKTTIKLTPKRHLYDAAGQSAKEHVRDIEAYIEELIGLDYERFLRSAMLAQGQFAQFLKAKPDERAALLESLTGITIYSELGELAYRETAQRERDLATRQQFIDQMPLLSEEEREKLLKDIPLTQKTYLQVKSDLDKTTQLLHKAKDLAEALSKEHNLVLEQEALAREFQNAEADLHRLTQHRLTIPFHADLARQEAAEASLTSATTLCQQAAEEYSQAFSAAHAYLRAYRQMVHEQVQATQQTIQANEAKFQKALADKTTAQQWLAEHPSDKALLENQGDFVALLADLKNYRKGLDREWTLLKNLARKVDPEQADTLPQLPAGLSRSMLTPALKALSKSLEIKRDALLTAGKKAGDELLAREDHLRKAKQIADFSKHRALLKKGEPCPLCGSTKHPFAEGTEPSSPFKELERRITEAKEICRQQQDELNELTRMETSLKECGSSLVMALDDCQRTTDELTTALQALELKLPEPGKEDVLKTNLQTRVTAYRTHAEQFAKAAQDETSASDEKVRLSKSLEELSLKASLLQSESLPEETARPVAPPAWKSLAAAEKDWANTKAAFEAKTTNLQNRKQDKERLEKQAHQLAQELSDQLQNSPFQSIAALKGARLSPADAQRIENVETNLKKRRQELQAHLQAIGDLIQKWREEAVPEGNAVADLSQRQADLQTQYNQLLRSLSDWQNRLDQDEVNRKAVAQQKKALDEERQRLIVWQKLRSLIGSADGRLFRRYAQSLSLDTLVGYANTHLQHLSERYLLRRRAGEELDLEIEDLHQSGAVRPMASLSGGESFLASLALALALSDMAGKKVRIESLFIDEGFASLDSDTLDTAISALETLRQDNKLIGVISHIDLLKERITTQISVEKQSGGTSRIRVL